MGRWQIIEFYCFLEIIVTTRIIAYKSEYLQGQGSCYVTGSVGTKKDLSQLTLHFQKANDIWQGCFKEEEKKEE